MERDERRLRIYYLNERSVIALLNFHLKLPEYLVYPEALPGVPEDAVVRSVHYDYSRMVLAVVLSHASFDPVLDGEMIPVVPQYVGEMPMTCIRLVPMFAAPPPFGEENDAPEYGVMLGELATPD